MAGADPSDEDLVRFARELLRDVMSGQLLAGVEQSVMDAREHWVTLFKVSEASREEPGSLGDG